MRVDWSQGLNTHLGIELVEVTRDRVRARLPLKPQVMATHGTVHGGTLMAFADTIGAVGTVENLAEGQKTSTVESKTNFFAPCNAGHLHAESIPLHRGKRTQVWQTRITDDAGKLLSLTIQTQLVL